MGGNEHGESKPDNDKSGEWMRADELLFNAIQNTSSACDEDSEPYVEIDEDFDDEEAYEDADEQFSSSVRALTTTDPRQAALFVAQPAN